MTLPAQAIRRELFVIGSFVEAHCWSVARAPGNDESVQANAYVRECAGKGLAVALGAHRVGAAVNVLIAAGYDAAGDALVALLKREGLSTAHVHRLGPHSGQGCGLISAQGDSTVTVFPGANLFLGAQELQHAAVDLQQAAVVYAQLEAPIPTVRAALEMGAAAGALIVLNPSPWPADVRLSQPGEWAALLSASRVLVVNRAEAAAWLSALEEGLALDRAKADLQALPTEVLSTLWRNWPAGEWLIVTLGAQGCLAYGRGGALHRLAGHAVAGCHPIGAGDAFSAGLCAALVEGKPMEEALRWANACGALAASGEGILAALPQRGDVAALLAEAG